MIKPSWPPGPPKADRRNVLLSGGLIVLVVFAAYRNSLSGPFILDDTGSIASNPTIRHLWPIWRTLSPPNGGLTVSGRPVLNFSLALSYALGGSAVPVYHIFNIAIHALATLTLFGLVHQTLERTRTTFKCRQGPAQAGFFKGSDPRSSLLLALCIALLWGVHPLQTEAVTYIVQRAESLMGLFYLLTLYCFVRGVKGGDGLEREARNSVFWHPIAVLCCLLGMATKEVMVSAPLMVLLYDRTFFAGTFAEAWKKRRLLYLGLAATWVLLGCLVISTGGNRGGSIGFGVGVSWPAYWLTQFKAITRYLSLTFWPHPLVFDYGTFWIKSLSQIVVSGSVVVILLAAAVFSFWRRPGLGFFGAWFFTILGTTSVPPGTTQMIVEHRMYLPLAAVITLAVIGLYKLIGRVSLIAFLALAAGCALLTAARNRDYKSEVTIWADVVRKCPDNSRAHGSLGHALAATGRQTEAIAEYQKALYLNPTDSIAHNDFGVALASLGRWTEAMKQYEAALRIRPAYMQAHDNMGAALLKRGKSAQAIMQFVEAVKYNPDSADAHLHLADALAQIGRPNDAIAQYREALRYDPDDALPHNNWGTVLSQMGQTNEAISQYREAIRLQPDFAEAHCNLGTALLKIGQPEQAAVQYQEALRLDPHLAEARVILAQLKKKADQKGAALGPPTPSPSR